MDQTHDEVLAALMQLQYELFVPGRRVNEEVRQAIYRAISAYAKSIKPKD